MATEYEKVSRKMRTDWDYARQDTMQQRNSTVHVPLLTLIAIGILGNDKKFTYVKSNSNCFVD